MKKILLLAAICGSVFAEQTYELNVPNMNCGGCAKKIEDAAKSVKGVKNFEVNLEAKTAQIIAEDDLPQNAVVDALKKQGYQAVLKSEK